MNRSETVSSHRVDVSLTLKNLPFSVAEEIQEVQRSDPDLIQRIVMYGMTRTAIFETLLEEAAIAIGKPQAEVATQVANWALSVAPGVMKSLGSIGKVVVTNHNQPEAVILSTEAYAALVSAVQEARRKDETALEALRARFDERLAALQADDAGDRLRAVMDAPAKLRGKVRAGATH